MSDALHKYYDFEKYKSEIVINTNHCLRYVNIQSVNAEEIVYTIHITNNVLKKWLDLKDSQLLNGIRHLRFVEILNCFLARNHAIIIKKDCMRIEEQLKRLTSEAKKKSSGKKGRAFVEFGKRSKSIAIRNGAVLQAGDLEKEVCELKAANSSLGQENSELQQWCDELYQSLLQEELRRNTSREQMEEVQAEVEKVKTENARLWQYIDIISEQEGYENCGKSISEVKGRQQRRKIREVKTCGKSALVCWNFWSET